MKFRLVFAAYLLSWQIMPAMFAVAADAEAEQQDSAEAAAESTEDLPAARPREIEFEVADEELEMKLFRADPELLKQQFVVDMEVFVPQTSERFTSVEQLARIERRSLVDFSRSYRATQPPAAFFRTLVDSLHEEMGHSIDFFLSDAAEKDYIQFYGPRSTPDSSGGYYQFRILAPSEQAARERATTLVWLLDRGIALPLQREMREAIQHLTETLDKLRVELAQAEEQAKSLSKEIEAAGEQDITSEELSRLKTERRLLDVDLAGIRARIEATEKLLADTHKIGGPPNRTEKLHDLKITAEIELAGLTARQKVLTELIDEASKREKLEAEYADAVNKIQRTRQSISSIEGQLQEYRQAAEAYSQLYSLKDGKVTIRPIRWTE